MTLGLSLFLFALGAILRSAVTAEVPTVRPRPWTRPADPGSARLGDCIQVLAEREPELRAHMDHVAGHAAATARRLGLPDDVVEQVVWAAELHDIGKVVVPDGVLHRPAPLDDDGWALMREHTVVGERMLRWASALETVAALVRASHERWDGTGYPDRLADEAIPLGARIVAVCDAYDAMVSDRAYRPAMPAEAALAELRRCAGTQFDPAVVDAFAAVIAEV